MPKFEECIQRLEKIVQELEQGEVPLEKSLTLFEEGMQLSGSCRKELEEAKVRWRYCSSKTEKFSPSPSSVLSPRCFAVKLPALQLCLLERS